MRALSESKKDPFAIMRCLQSLGLLMLVFLFSACSVSDMQHNTYKALQTRQCISGDDAINCDSDTPTYNEYRQQYEEAIDK